MPIRMLNLEAYTFLCGNNEKNPAILQGFSHKKGGQVYEKTKFSRKREGIHL
jgi:hypothetical protein